MEHGIDMKLNFFLIYAAVVITFLGCTSGQVAAQVQITAHLGTVSSYDGRSRGEDWTGAWVAVNQVRINGELLSRSSFSFEFSGNYGLVFQNIGLSSRRTMPSLTVDVARHVDHYDLGHRYWINKYSIPNIHRMVQSVDRNDQEIAYAICGLMSQPDFVSTIIPRMIQDRRGDEVYASYWLEPSRVREMNEMGASCMNQMRRLVQFETPVEQAVVQQAQTRRQPSASDFQQGFTTESQGSPRSGTTGPADRVRLAQSILAAMGLYTSSIDGVAGPRTNRALTDAMQQMNSTASPTIENFLTVAVNRITTNEQPNSPINNATETSKFEAERISLSNRLETTSEALVSVRAELDQVKQELETERLAAAYAATGADNETIATLELQVAELTAQLERTQAGVRGTDALNATIADLSEELVVLRPLPSQIVVLEAENDGLQRQLSAANVTVADLREGIAADERVGELQRQLNAANATIADLSERAASAEDLNALLQRQLGDLNQSFSELRNNAENQASQLSAANETIAELRERMNTAFVPATEHAELQRQLSAAVATNTELRETIRSNYVSRADFLDAQRVLAAANESMADIRRAIETEFMPLEDYNRLERQVAALNSTILEIQDRNEIQRNRMIESEAMFRNFRDDCAAVPECARAMRLE